MLGQSCAGRLTGGAGGQVEIDLKQQLLYMQMTIKDIGAQVNVLDRKMDASSHGVNSVEQALLQLKQQQITSSMDHGMKAVELGNLIKKNIEHQSSVLMQAETTSMVIPGGQGDSGGAALSSKHQESLQKIEALLQRQLQKSDGVHDILSKGIATGNPHPALREGKAGAPVVDGIQQVDLHRELELLQMSLTKDMKMLLQEFQQQSLLLQQSLLENFHGTNLMASSQIMRNGLHQQGMNPANKQAGGDFALVDADADRGFRTDVDALAQVVSDGFGTNGASANGASTLPQAPRRNGERRRGSKRLSQQKHQQSQEGVIAKEGAHEEDDENEELIKDIQLKEDGSLASVFSCDDDLCGPAYNVENFYYKTGVMQKIARSKLFENFTVGVVVFNAVYIGFDSDYNDAENAYDAAIPFQACSQFFAVYFTWELLTRLFAFEHKRDCLQDGWFKFDAFLVSTMVLDIWVLMPVLRIIGGGVTIPTQPLRMLRLFKLTRMARLMQAFPELVTMIKGLVRSLRAISSSMILIGLMVYVWAIMMHMLLKEEYEFNEKLWRENLLGFATMTQCIWTLLMDGTLMLDNSAPLMTSLLFSDKMNFILAGIGFMTYALLSAMLILQMLIGVLCDVVSRVGSEQRDSIAIGLVKQELLHAFERFDNGNGKVNQDQLLEVMNEPFSKALLKKLNINRLFLLQLQKVMFVKHDSLVTIKSVLELMVMCRGDNATTVESLSGGLLSVIREISELKQMMSSEIHSMRDHIERDLTDMLDDGFDSGEEAT